MYPGDLEGQLIVIFWGGGGGHLFWQGLNYSSNGFRLSLVSKCLTELLP